jgi:chromosome segregation ATPase
VLKIYSIKELVDATNSFLLASQVEEKKLIKNNFDADSSFSETITPNIKNKKRLFLEGSIPSEIENIIFEAENSELNNKKNKPIKKIIQQNKDDQEELKVSKDELIESMYKTFSKKIKKNTLKLILDLREEIIFLTKNISLLKEKKKEQELNKDILKKDVVDLNQIVNELNLNLKKIQTDFYSLKEQNKDLNLNYDELKEQNKNLSLDYEKLKEQNKNLSLDYDLLKNDNIEINSQSFAYKNKYLESKLKIEKLEKEEKKLREKNQYLEKTIEDLKLKINNNVDNSNTDELENKIKHYQEENIRISSELVESNKRYEITKESLSELQDHRGHLIEKINSINEVIKNENVVTSAFSSNLVDNKINVIDSRKPTKKGQVDLNEEIKKIFSNS